MGVSLKKQKELQGGFVLAVHSKLGFDSDGKAITNKLTVTSN